MHPECHVGRWGRTCRVVKADRLVTLLLFNVILKLHILNGNAVFWGGFLPSLTVNICGVAPPQTEALNWDVFVSSFPKKEKKNIPLMHLDLSNPPVFSSTLLSISLSLSFSHLYRVCQAWCAIMPACIMDPLTNYIE